MRSEAVMESCSGSCGRGRVGRSHGDGPIVWSTQSTLSAEHEGSANPGETPESLE